MYILQMAGVWYEIGRAPDYNVLKCLNITVPRTASSELVLDLEYIATWDGSNRVVKETVSFPWDVYTRNSTFHLYYGLTEGKPSVTYKVIYTDFRFILICGYAGISPAPLFKILSRQRIADQKVIDYIQNIVDKSVYRYYFMWTEQSKCNAADRSVAGTISLLTLANVWLLLIGCLSLSSRGSIFIL